MLTLLPLSGLHSALKRRNSKTYDFSSRRGSLAVYSTYSLPNSKNSMRRFSSYEELAPIFQMLGEDKTSNAKSLKRKSSIRKSVAPRRDSTCADLDAQIARIKGQLAKFKNEDIEISQRVDDLSSSVEELCCGRQLTPFQKDRPPSSLSSGCESSGSTLEVISESNNESDEDCNLEVESDVEQTFEDYCQKVIPKLGRTRSKMQPLRFVEVDFDCDTTLPDPKEHCILNNLIRPPRAKSTTQLDIVRNDLTKHDIKYSPRLSTVSCNSDSVLFVHRHHWPAPSEY